MAGPVHQLKVSLDEAYPTVWRRLQLRSGASLAQLHEAIQVAFGWEGYHLHRFDGPEDHDEGAITLADYAPREGLRFSYLYDFGDCWHHLVEVEKVIARPRSTSGYPRCTAGQRACPPEDCGGPWAYVEAVRALRSRKGMRYQWAREALGTRRWDVNAFDRDRINAALAALSATSETSGTA